MALRRRLISDHYPFIPLTVRLGSSAYAVRALMDTDFDGDLVVPAGFFDALTRPDNYLDWFMADDRHILVPMYLATIELDQLGIFPTTVAALGSEVLVGRHLLDRFLITIDHGRRVRIEP
jgi:predicted aspartyl protease